MTKTLAACAALVFPALAFAQAASTAPGTPLKILKDVDTVVVQTIDGPVTITREMTACAKNAGVLQPLIPVEGVHPVGEIEILEALNDTGAVVIDMRDLNDRVKGTIPGSVGIPYTEVASRLNELGCSKTQDKWRCDQAKDVYAFCNGPVCPQSPIAIRAMTREGFPADKIYYYRGGMLDWEALGLTTIKDQF